MKKIFIHVLDLVNFIISFLVCRWFFMEYLYFYFTSIFGFPESGVDFWRPLFAILIISFILFTIVRSLYTHKLDIRLVKIIYLLYFFVLLYSLLFKNLGIQGINLNLISFIKDSIFIDSKVPLLNILIFIPLGALFGFKYKNISIFFFGVVSLEVIQYIFHLGFFDVGDIFTNTIGFIIGNMIYDSKIGKKIIQTIKR
ncbi:VanZ family protein [Streptococcus infantis]|uniref:VanZ family protein n=1 Tax=Streptococcus infantis TaxID=68892 RepID=UPI001CBC2924|nr:VanZ family protein [Streptococcus infantis]MBZ2110803.1 VanZ family protein [Streptococcus infantis]MBZ2112519.1 VanZ family protein [Streptococcus infantis]